MSKSLNGSGSLNLTLNELRLLEIKATKVTGTDLVSLSNVTGNNATFTGTVTLGDISVTGDINGNLVGNVTGDLVGDVVGRHTGRVVGTVISASGDITTLADITANGTITASGNVTSIANVVGVNLTASGGASSQTLAVSGNSVLNTSTFTGTVELDSVPNITVDSYTSILLHGDNNEINQDNSFSYNSSLNLLQAININSNGTITANTISCDNLTASAGLSAQTLTISGNSVLNTATFTGKIELDLVPNQH